MSSNIPLTESQTKVIIIALVLTSVINMVFVLWRLYIGKKSWSFWLLFLAWILSLGVFAILLASAIGYVSGNVDVLGLKSLKTFHKELYFGSLASIVITLLTKLSILSFYLETASDYKMYPQVTMVVVICEAVAFGFPLIFRCTPIHKFWDVAQEGFCVNTYTLSLANAAFDFATYVWIHVMPLPIIWNLRMYQPQKIILLSLGALSGVVIIIVFILRIINLSHQNTTSTDVNWNATIPTVYLNAELQAGILSACMGSLKSAWSHGKRLICQNKSDENPNPDGARQDYSDLNLNEANHSGSDENDEKPVYSADVRAERGENGIEAKNWTAEEWSEDE